MAVQKIECQRRPTTTTSLMMMMMMMTTGNPIKHMEIWSCFTFLCCRCRCCFSHYDSSFSFAAASPGHLLCLTDSPDFPSFFQSSLGLILCSLRLAYIPAQVVVVLVWHGSTCSIVTPAVNDRSKCASLNYSLSSRSLAVQQL